MRNHRQRHALLLAVAFSLPPKIVTLPLLTNDALRNVGKLPAGRTKTLSQYPFLGGTLNAHGEFLSFSSLDGQRFGKIHINHDNQVPSWSESDPLATHSKTQQRAKEPDQRFAITQDSFVREAKIEGDWRTLWRVPLGLSPRGFSGANDGSTSINIWGTQPTTILELIRGGRMLRKLPLPAGLEVISQIRCSGSSILLFANNIEKGGLEVIQFDGLRPLLKHHFDVSAGLLGIKSLRNCEDLILAGDFGFIRWTR